MGARQQLAERLAPQYIGTAAGEELEGRVRLAAFEVLGGERAAEPGDVVAHPALEPAERQIMLPKGRHRAPRKAASTFVLIQKSDALVDPPVVVPAPGSGLRPARRQAPAGTHVCHEYRPSPV
jgi:hypothetical protein